MTNSPKRPRAIRIGRKLAWDPKKEFIVGDDEASQTLSENNVKVSKSESEHTPKLTTNHLCLWETSQ